MTLAQTLLTFVDVCALLWTVIYSVMTGVTFWCIAMQSTLSKQLHGRLEWTPKPWRMVLYFLSIAWLITRASTS